MSGARCLCTIVCNYGAAPFTKVLHVFRSSLQTSATQRVIPPTFRHTNAAQRATFDLTRQRVPQQTDLTMMFVAIMGTSVGKRRTNTRAAKRTGIQQVVNLSLSSYVQYVSPLLILYLSSLLCGKKNRKPARG